MQLLEGQLAWFVHIISAILKGRLSSSSTSAESQVPPPSLVPRPTAARADSRLGRPPRLGGPVCLCWQEKFG